MSGDSFKSKSGLWKAGERTNISVEAGATGSVFEWGKHGVVKGGIESLAYVHHLEMSVLIAFLGAWKKTGSLTLFCALTVVPDIFLPYYRKEYNFCILHHKNYSAPFPFKICARFHVKALISERVFSLQIDRTASNFPVAVLFFVLILEKEESSFFMLLVFVFQSVPSLPPSWELEFDALSTITIRLDQQELRRQNA